MFYTRGFIHVKIRIHKNSVLLIAVCPLGAYSLPTGVADKPTSDPIPVGQGAGFTCCPADVKCSDNAAACCDPTKVYVENAGFDGSNAAAGTGNVLEESPIENACKWCPEPVLPDGLDQLSRRTLLFTVTLTTVSQAEA